MTKTQTLEKRGKENIIQSEIDFVIRIYINIIRFGLLNLKNLTSLDGQREL